MAEDVRPIVIKRIKKVAGGHHGGAWKLAYADFVTAMMAFFLLMWLLSSVAEADRKAIAEYFQNPLQVVSFTTGSASGDPAGVLMGGNDITQPDGKGDKQKTTKDAEELRKELEKHERKRLQGLKQRIEGMIENNFALKQFKDQLLIEVTPEGLRIQIVDAHNRPMFDASSPELKSYSKEILRQIGKVLGDPEIENRLSLSGHTDATQYGGGEKGFSNWELSANRANAARRELIVGGLREGQVLRVVGSSSTVPYERSDPLNPINRRISILVLNKRTEEAMLQEDGNVPLDFAEETESEANAAP